MYVVPVVTTPAEATGRGLMLNATPGDSATNCCPKEIHGRFLSSVGILILIAVK